MIKTFDRIKQIRNAVKKTQQEFADDLGISKSNLVSYEVGRRNPSDAVVSLICSKYDVNEEWLRNGTGEMYLPKTKEEELGDFIGDVMADLDESFRKRFVLALSKLTPEQWDLLEQIVDNVKKQE